MIRWIYTILHIVNSINCYAIKYVFTDKKMINKRMMYM